MIVQPRLESQEMLQGSAHHNDSIGPIAREQLRTSVLESPVEVNIHHKLSRLQLQPEMESLMDK